MVVGAACGSRGCAGTQETVAGSLGAVPSVLPEPSLPGVASPDRGLMKRLAAALREKGPDYEPRTHHLKPDGLPKYLNRLILETSPYLLQHAHNPVNWFRWGEEAFERARRQGKPVLVSIGYSTCHWCHVMERESFEDEEVARFINENYVAIKVDREERPDLDDVYMKAVQMLTGRGGWPMTVVLTPEKDPFFGGTYFPARDGDRGARKGFLTILRELRVEFDGNRSGVVARARELSQRIQASSSASAAGGVPDATTIEQAVREARASFDATWGGFGRAPKFPRPVLLELLLRSHRRTRDAHELHMVTHTLEHMAAGGIYDHVGGGFHRYSTDARWLVPHFEKMLYDNAQLVALYLEAFQITGRQRFAEVARDTLAYVAREMTAIDGGFYSATDADSQTPLGQQEGYFFTWTPSELEEVLGADRARAVATYYGVTASGNFEGRSILHLPSEGGRGGGRTAGGLQQTIVRAREDLYEARSERPPPHRDEKVLTSWNGLMISGFARAALVFGDRKYAMRAARAAEFVLGALRGDGGGLLRSFKDGRASHNGYLDDYAFLIQGLIDLYEATANKRWLEEALSLQALLDRHFSDSSGGYFMTSNDHERLIAREKPTYDGAEPSGNSVALMNLVRLTELTMRREYRAKAEKGFAAFSGQLTRSPGASAKMLSALDAYLDRPVEVFVVRPDASADAEPLVARFRSAYLPNRVFTMTVEGQELAALSKLVPGLEGKRALKGRTTAFVCEQGSCQLPTSEPDVFASQLAKVGAIGGPAE